MEAVDQRTPQWLQKVDIFGPVVSLGENPAALAGWSLTSCVSEDLTWCCVHRAAVLMLSSRGCRVRIGSQEGREVSRLGVPASFSGDAAGASWCCPLARGGSVLLPPSLLQTRAVHWCSLRLLSASLLPTLSYSAACLQGYPSPCSPASCPGSLSFLWGVP